MSDIIAFDAMTTDPSIVGGKGSSLGEMLRAGLPVPPGFCISAAVHRRLRHAGPDGDLRAAIIEAYRKLGGGPVAVRSSATAEDGTTTSFAGQQDTYLGIEGDEAVADAVGRCWASLDNERAVAYRRRQNIAEDGLAMAVVVQRMVPAEVAGVIFTRDPLDPSGQRMLIEAAWGLGESVVSGRVQPDRFTVDRDTHGVIDRQLGQKTVRMTAGGESPVAAADRDRLCLTDSQLTEIAGLGRRVESHFGQPRDVEWAWADGRCWLLQARPITAAGAAETDMVRREEIAAFQMLVAAGGTVWVRHNLAEVLPEPTPMTWAIVRRFMSATGGYGRMYVDLGFEPDSSMADQCIYDLICGRPYMSLAREPRMQWGDLPFGHPIRDIKNDPNRAFVSQANFIADGAGFGAKIRTVWRMVRGSWKVQAVTRTFAADFQQKVVPEFVAATQNALAMELASLDSPAILGLLNEWITRALVEFARHSLKPTAFAAAALGAVQKIVEPKLGPDRARAAVAELAMGARPEADVDLAAGISAFAAGAMDRDTFLRRFGHRGANEMELAAPRWREQLSIDRETRLPVSHPITELLKVIDAVAGEAGLTDARKAFLRREVDKLHIWLALRETGKHHLMRGYEIIRRLLVELDRRSNLDGGIFYLEPSELPDLVAGQDLRPAIERRKRRRAVALAIELPPVLMADDPEAIGRPLPPPDGALQLQGIGLSSGVVEAPAFVVQHVHEAVAPNDGYVLVCPTTDPAWVPLFARAKGLVMETGGVLSHGAIVAREFGLPAVAGLPGILRRVRSGQTLRVDGARGTVTLRD